MRVFLRNEHVLLRPLELSDLEGNYPSWFDDEVVCSGNNHHRFPYNRESMTNYIHQSQSGQGQLVLAIIDAKTQQHVGNVAIANIDWINRSADLTIIIGERGKWQSGYGYNACYLIVKHAFKSLQLNRISMGTFETNLGMQRIGEKLGFKQEGRRRQAIFKDGVYVDVLEYGLLAAEFQC